MTLSPVAYGSIRPMRSRLRGALVNAGLAPSASHSESSDFGFILPLFDAPGKAACTREAGRRL
jgi:hypothetical protein